MKSSLLFFILLTTLTNAQLNTNYSQRPIKGLTYVPNVSELILENGFVYGTASSLFRAEDEVPYSQLVSERADPVEKFTTDIFTIGIGITDRIGLAVSIPYIFSHDFIMNPRSGYENYTRDVLGKVGFSDIAFTGWFLVFKESSFRSLISLSVKLPTADYPSGETTFLNSTGTGNTHIKLGAAFETELIKGLLTSTSFDYIYKTEREVARLTPWATGIKEFIKPGDEINIRLKTSYEITNNFAAGFEGIYNTANRTKVRYQDPRENSYYNSLLISPVLGYQYEFVNINAGYAWTISGQNISKMNFLMIGLHVNFSLI